MEVPAVPVRHPAGIQIFTFPPGSGAFGYRMRDDRFAMRYPAAGPVLLALGVGV